MKWIEELFNDLNCNIEEHGSGYSYYEKLNEEDCLKDIKKHYTKHIEEKLEALSSDLIDIAYSEDWQEIDIEKTIRKHLLTE